MNEKPSVPNDWRDNSHENPFWKQKKPVELKFKDGHEETTRFPGANRRLMKEVNQWRYSDVKPREVKPDFTKGFQYEDIRVWVPSIKERFLLAIGFNVTIGFKANTQHKPGKTAIGIFPQLTAHDAFAAKHFPTLARIFVNPNPETTIKEGVLMEKAAPSTRDV